MRRFFAALLLLFVCLSGCSRKEDIAFTVEDPTIHTTSSCTELAAETSVSEPTLSSGEEIRETIPEFSFDALGHTNFYFSSGAGAWSTQLIIQPDGSFSGVYNDHDSIEGEGYPYGIHYHCDFSGSFSQPVQINAYTWSVQLLDLTYANTPDTEEIKDQALYCYTTAHGLEDAQEFLIYLPGAPLAQLPEEFRYWVGYYDLENAEETTLPFFGFYNEAQQQGFRGEDMIQAVRELVVQSETEAAYLDSLLGAASTQADMNIAATDKYQVWDNTLNSLWAVLKRVLNEEEMAQLTREELAWIAEKEAAIAAAGAEVEGGSLYPLVTGTKGAELTKQRVYELLELLP